jgi:hypothetical protein
MAKTPFDRRFADPPSIALVRRILAVFVVAHVPLALWSGYRAIVRVQRLELREPPPEVRELSVEVRRDSRRPDDVRS